MLYQFTRNTFQKLFDVVLNHVFITHCQVPSLQNSHLVTLSPLCQLNDSLSQLYTDFRSFKLHLDWLIDVRVSMSLPVSLKTVEVTRGLQHILSLCTTALQQVGSSIYSGYSSGVCGKSLGKPGQKNKSILQPMCCHNQVVCSITVQFTCLATVIVRLGTDLGSTYALRFLTLSISERKNN